MPLYSIVVCDLQKARSRQFPFRLMLFLSHKLTSIEIRMYNTHARMYMYVHTYVRVHVTSSRRALLYTQSRLSLHKKISETSKNEIRESVDSLCRDDADMPMPPYIRKAYNRPNAAFVSLFRWLTVILECFST